MKDAQRGLDASFRRTFGRGIDAAERFARLEIHGVDLDYDSRLRDALAATDAETVKAAAARHLDPERLLVLCVGDIESMKDGDGLHPQKLADLGPMTKHAGTVAVQAAGPDGVVRQVLDALREGDLEAVKKHATQAMLARLEEAPDMERRLGMFKRMLGTAKVSDPETETKDDEAKTRVKIEAKMGEQEVTLFVRLGLVKDGDVWKCDTLQVGQ